MIFKCALYVNQFSWLALYLALTVTYGSDCYCVHYGSNKQVEPSHLDWRHTAARKMDGTVDRSGVQAWIRCALRALHKIQWRFCIQWPDFAPFDNQANCSHD